MQTTIDTNGSCRLRDTVAAVLLAFALYPKSIAPTGASSNGGLIGICSLVAAAFFSWRAFHLNRRSSWLRGLLQLPLVAVLSHLAIREAFVQFVSGHALWL
jgi:hypothetical protein